ncbi:MAG: bifunctional adenosylcobinamide kinase/adenosylcobinamide-phosphate guanylyltransferase [Ornithinimicrobium sp.]
MITVVLGGTRSGKSDVAERLASAATGGQVSYIATAAPTVDEDFAARIAAHRARRPDSWATLECVQPQDLVTHLREAAGVVLIDSLGTWVTRHEDLVVEPDALLRGLLARHGDTIIVSEEVGLAVHPPTAVGRRYVDAVGTLNQQVAAIADRVLLVVAGHILALQPFDA